MISRKALLRLGRSGMAGVLTMAAACGDSLAPNISRDDIAGAYVLVELAFDPQGILPEIDLAQRLAALGKPPASLVLTSGGDLQLLFEDPAASLLRLVEGSFRTTPTGAVLNFGGNVHLRSLFLSPEMTFVRDADLSLRFDGAAPAGVSRSALLVLVPEWAGEPTIDPMPGALRVVFERIP